MTARKKATLKFHAYTIVEESIYNSIPSGIRKYYKYHDEPEVKDMESLTKWIYEYIMLDLAEVIDWENC
jgi:hypothetical protein